MGLREETRGILADLAKKKFEGIREILDAFMMFSLANMRHALLS